MVGRSFAGHLFDRLTFDEAIPGNFFIRKELADYFKDQKEDIFDYIPPQKTNQISSKRVVRRMVDDLENSGNL